MFGWNGNPSGLVGALFEVIALISALSTAPATDVYKGHYTNKILECCIMVQG